ncbi:unnamed protein product, partial [Mesorhabditis spiculigera]
MNESPVVVVHHKKKQIVKIAAGENHLAMLSELYGIGRNVDNALGLGTYNAKEDDENWKYDELQKIVIPGVSAGVTAKLTCSVAWDRDGKGYAWGVDTSGQLGLGITDDDDKVVPTPREIKSAHLDGYKIISASIADNHTLFLAKKI